MIVIRTAYSTDAKGAGRIVAKGNGKQRTTRYDPALSNDRNHGEAAGNLALVLDLPWDEGIEHDQSEDGTKHGFAWTPPVLIRAVREHVKTL